ncbi:hypothetical protein HYPDE_33183 [Hyphomicrobium denitrificans 1NES1]|uniref:Uncharacterized protein n=2 Tax=Hyphomicrobium denitrificans TaxID=53399 RepID=N0B460_9HYPH|nr:hypothetical protein HYPDE_33183 [Hyphomicrobium denitrificans 1NES1]
MTCPTVEVTGRKVFLVSGYDMHLEMRLSKHRAGHEGLTDRQAVCSTCNASVEIEALQELQRSAKKNPDAVAFGYVMGKWIPAA